MHGPLNETNKGFLDLSSREAWVIAPVLVAHRRARRLPQAAARRDQPGGQGTRSASNERTDPPPITRAASASSPVSTQFDHCDPSTPRASTWSVQVILADAITAPQVQYRALLPILIVLGVATVGVLVEAILPAAQRRLTQLVLALGGLVAAFVAVVANRNRGGIVAQSMVAQDRPTLFLQGTILLLAFLSFLFMAEHSLDADGGAFVGQASARTGLGRGAAGQRRRPRADRGLPAVDVRGQRHAAVPGVERPAADVRRARGLLAAALPAVRPGPPAPAALAGGGGEVLPARRVLLRLLPVRHRAGLRLRALGRPRRDPYRGRRARSRTPCSSPASR